MLQVELQRVLAIDGASNAGDSGECNAAASIIALDSRYI